MEKFFYNCNVLLLFNLLRTLTLKSWHQLPASPYPSKGENTTCIRCIFLPSHMEMEEGNINLMHGIPPPSKEKFHLSYKYSTSIFYRGKKRRFFADSSLVEFKCIESYLSPIIFKFTLILLLHIPYEFKSIIFKMIA